MSYISDNQHILLLFVVVILAVFSWLSERTKIGQILSGAILVMLFGMILSNFKIVPHSAFMFDQIAIYSVPLAIPLLLLNANLRTIFRESGITLLAFLMACMATCLGAVVGYFLVDMGEFGNLWAGVFSASYTGGTLNFVSVSSALSVPESGIAAAVAADTVIGIAYLFVLTGMARSRRLLHWLSSGKPVAECENTESSPEPNDKAVWLADSGKILLTLGLSATIYFFSREIAVFFNVENITILIVTMLALFLANVVPQSVANSKGAFHVGTLLMYGFFFVIAAGADLQSLLNSAEAFSIFLLILVVVHLTVVMIGARYFKIGLPELVIASCACVIGPSVAAALAANRNWVLLITPAILCGTLGYAIGNFIGIALAYILP